jgi:hypothetical protein
MAICSVWAHARICRVSGGSHHNRHCAVGSTAPRERRCPVSTRRTRRRTRGAKREQRVAHGEPGLASRSVGRRLLCDHTKGPRSWRWPRGEHLWFGLVGHLTARARATTRGTHRGARECEATRTRGGMERRALRSRCALPAVKSTIAAAVCITLTRSMRENAAREHMQRMASSPCAVCNRWRLSAGAFQGRQVVRSGAPLGTPISHVASARAAIMGATRCRQAPQPLHAVLGAA